MLLGYCKTRLFRHRLRAVPFSPSNGAIQYLTHVSRSSECLVSRALLLHIIVHQLVASSGSSRLSRRAWWRRRVRWRATELIHQLLDEIFREGLVFVRPRQFCRLARVQRLVRIAAMPLVLYFTMDSTDRAVETRAAEDLSSVSVWVL